MDTHARKHWVRGVIIASCILVGLGALLVILRATRTVAPPYTGAVERVSTGLIGEYASLILIAEDQGYFKRHGLEVAIKEYASGPEALADVWSGTIDTAMASDFAGVRDTLNGHDVKIHATLSKSEAFFIVANKDSGISTPASLKGKKIGFTSKTVGEFFLGQFLTFNKLTMGDIKKTDLPPAALADALVSGQIDAAALFEPNAYKAQARLGDKAVRVAVQSGQHIYSQLYSTGRFAHERPEAMKRYMRALVEAESFVRKNNSEARAIVAKRLKYDQAYIDYIWPQFAFEVSLDQELLLNMDDEARWAMERGLTTAQKTPNFLRNVDFTGLDAAKPEGITIIR
jgi:NitT/TauT family transport system substrate-binding protein